MAGYIEAFRSFVWELPAVIFHTLYLLQFALPIWALTHLFRKKGIFNIRKLPLLYSLLAGTICFYMEIKLNGVLFALRLPTGGIKGLALSFGLLWVLFLPVLAMLAIIFRAEYKSPKHYLVFNFAVYLTAYMIHIVAMELWYPGLVNYGTAY